MAIDVESLTDEELQALLNEAESDSELSDALEGIGIFDLPTAEQFSELSPSDQQDIADTIVEATQNVDASIFDTDASISDVIKEAFDQYEEQPLVEEAAPEQIAQDAIAEPQIEQVPFNEAFDSPTPEVAVLPEQAFPIAEEPIADVASEPVSTETGISDEEIAAKIAEVQQSRLNEANETDASEIASVSTTPPEVTALPIKNVDEGVTGTTTGDATDATLLTQIPTNRDVSVIGADGGLFSGGLGTGVRPSDVLRVDPQIQQPGIYLTPEQAARAGISTERPGESIFNPGALLGTGANLLTGSTLGGGAPVATSANAAPELGGATPAIVPAGGVRDVYVKTPDDVKEWLRTGGKAVGDTGAFLELANQDKLTQEQVDYLRRSALAISSEEDPTPQLNTSSQGGIPLAIPIPGLDPTQALILTAAGFILSGGNIARLDPNKPIQSVTGAVQGVGQTAQNAVDLATGRTDLETIWSGGPAGSTGPGGAAGAGAGQQTGIGVAPIFGGGMGGSGASGAGSATGGMGAGQTTTGGSPAITGGALGGAAGDTPSGGTTSSGKPSGQEMPSTGGPYIFDQSERVQNILGQILAPSQAIQQQKVIDDAAAATASTGGGAGAGAGGVGGGDTTTGGGTTGVVGGTTTGPTTGTTPTGTTPTGTRGGDTTTGGGTPGVTTTGGGGGGGGTGTAVSNTGTSGTGDEGPTNTNPPGIMPSTTSPSTGTAPTGAGTASTFIINPIAGGYTLPTAGTPVARNLYQEASTTTQALGTPMQRAVIGKDAAGNDILGNVPIDPATGQPMTVSQGIAAGYGGLARGMTSQDITNLLQSIGAQTGAQLTPGTAGGYQKALTDAAIEQTKASNAALRAGNIADAEAFAQRALNLRNQANQGLFGEAGVLPQFTRTAQEQVSRDVGALRRAEAGELSPEEIRNAQQAAREAYAARGQVFSQGAAAQEVLNRQAAVQQRQQLARQNLAQSMGQLGQGVGYQTANIFDPFGTTLGAQYGMQSQNVGLNQALYNQAMGLSSGAGGYGFAQQMINPFTGYAQDVYSSNVNAVNAAQIAAANRQAALEAAKMGQTGTYAQALGGLISSGGLGQIQSGITGGIQGLLDLLGGKWPTK